MKRIDFTRRLIPSQIRRLLRDQAGAMAVEFAVLGPILAFLLLMAADLGLALWQKAQVANAARAGVQYAAIHGWNSSAITSAAQSANSLTVAVTPSTYCGCAGTNSIATQSCGSTCASGAAIGTYVSVTTQATYTPISPAGWGSSNTNLSITARTRIN